MSEIGIEKELDKILATPPDYTPEQIQMAVDALKRIESRAQISDEQWAAELAADFAKITD